MKKNNNYFNTNKQQGDKLIEAETKALALKDLIFELFKAIPERKTPFEVSVLLVKNGYKYPITSVRAIMTTLSKESFLTKSARVEKLGEYGADNHTWALAFNHFGKPYDKSLFVNLN
jgi:hypothetical protein